MNVVTRFAPSPTGYLHLGGVRTALFNYLFAKHYNGKFLLRIEDTDDKRLLETSINSILDGLKWLGINHDGSLTIQSQNLQRHHDVANQLIKENKAYYCYCTQEELDNERKKTGFGYKYSGKCKNRTDKPNTKPSIRLNSETFKEIKFNDLIFGEATYGRDNLDDFIIIRSDGVPTYMFAVVVDDYDSNVTHVIRGNDHHTNTAKQLMIYKLLNWGEPYYVHLPLINSDDGTKMSKRKHAVDILDYKNNGFLAPALLNYLMHLGWSPKKEILSMQEAIEVFGIGGLNSSPACFDMKKLKNINNHYMTEVGQQNPNELLKLLDENYFANYHKTIPDNTRIAIANCLDELVKRSSSLREIFEQGFFYFDNWRNQIPNKNKISEFENQLKSKIENLEEFSLLVQQKFSKLDESSWNSQSIENLINEVAAEYKSIKKSDLMKFIRVKLTGVLNSFSIVKIIETLGCKETLNRLSYTN